MFFLDDLKKIKREDELYKYIIQTKNNLQKIIEIQYTKRSTLTQILDKIANVDVNQIKVSNTKSLLSIIEETKITLDRINDNLPGLNDLMTEISELINKINECIDKNFYIDIPYKDVEFFYVLYNEKINMLTEINIVYERIIVDVYTYVLSGTQDTFNIQTKNILEPKKKDIKSETDINNEDKENKKDSDEKNILDYKEEVVSNQELSNGEMNANEDEKISIAKETDYRENENEGKLKDNNVLKISEIDNKVYLPYKVYDLEKIWSDNPEEYKSISDIIDEEYIIPLEKYKNSAFSRFKEAYNLMRYKEQGSFSEAIDLALEVTFINGLNPAVISACKDLDELDNYLDCLDENKLDDFKAFKIEYEGFPDIKR